MKKEDLAAKTKREGGVDFPSEAYAYVPDPASPSTWKLRLWEDPDKKETAAQIGRALAAIGPGFRGQKVQVPSDDRPAVLSRIKSAWKKTHPDAGSEDMPAVLKKKTFSEEDKTEDFIPGDFVSEYNGALMSSEGKWETGETDFHVHVFEATDAFTEVPRGLYRGHRHAIMRNGDGRVIGFEESAGHTHPLPDWVLNSPATDDKTLDEDSDAEVYAGDLKSVKGVEIFKVGTWNGDKYSRSDLDEMAANFDKVGFQVPIKLGHSTKVGEPAYGWIESVRRVGDKLVADFKDLPKKIWQALKDHRFDQISAEIFWNLERNGKTFRRVLKAVALLGAETPAVSGLAPLRTVVNSAKPPEDGFDRVCVYSFKLAEEEDEDMSKIEELQERVDALTSDLEEAKEAALAAEQVAEEAGKKGKAAEQAQADLAEAQTKVTQLTEDLRKSKEAVKKLAEDQAKTISDLQEKVETLSTQLGDVTEDRRKDRIKKKVEEVPIPALRRFFEPLYDLATSTARVVSFTAKDGEDPKDVSFEAVLDGMIEHLKQNASKLFTELAENKGLDEEHKRRTSDPTYSDPSAEADLRARKYMDEHEKVSYVDAVQHVLKEDPELKEAYASFSTAPAQH